MLSRTIGIIGDGAQATAIAYLLEKKAEEVRLNNPGDERYIYPIYQYCTDRDEDFYDEYRRTRVNKKYFPYVELSSTIISNNLMMPLYNSDFLFLAVPMNYAKDIIRTKDFIRNLEGNSNKNLIVISLAKGASKNDEFLMHVIFRNTFPERKKNYCAMVTPGFSKEIVEQEKTIMYLAANDQGCAKKVVKLMSHRGLEIRVIDDMLALEYAGAVKSLVSLVVSLVRRYEVYRGLEETMQDAFMPELLCIADSVKIKDMSFVKEFLSSIKPDQYQDYAGLMDISHKDREELFSRSPLLFEAENTVRAFRHYTRTFGVDAPIIKALYHIVDKNADPRQKIKAVTRLFNKYQ